MPKFTVTVTLDHVSGPVREDDHVLDSFAGGIGEQNGMLGRAMRFTVSDFNGDTSMYKVTLVDDAPEIVEAATAAATYRHALEQIVANEKAMVRDHPVIVAKRALGRG